MPGRYTSFILCVAKSAAIAQSVEHFIRNEKVVGSSPTRGSWREIQQSPSFY